MANETQPEFIPDATVDMFPEDEFAMHQPCSRQSVSNYNSSRKYILGITAGTLIGLSGLVEPLYNAITHRPISNRALVTAGAGACIGWNLAAYCIDQRKKSESGDAQ